MLWLLSDALQVEHLVAVGHYAGKRVKQKAYINGKSAVAVERGIWHEYMSYESAKGNQCDFARFVSGQEMKPGQCNLH